MTAEPSLLWGPGAAHRAIPLQNAGIAFRGGRSTGGSRRPEAIIPEYTRVSAAHCRHGEDYSIYRSSGTKDWLVLLTLEGGGIFHDASSEAHSVEPGDIVLLDPGSLHDYRTDPRSGVWEYLCAHFRARAEWIPLLDWPELAEGLRRLRLDGESREEVLKDLCETVRWSRSVRPHNGLLGLNRLESALLWCDAANPVSGSVDERLLRVAHEIEDDLQRHWTVGDMARTAALSTSRITALFQEQFSLTPMEYLESRRMLIAAQMLDLTSRSVGEIAGLVGYRDPLYFSSRFRRRFGQSPRAYRNRPVDPDRLEGPS